MRLKVNMNRNPTSVSIVVALVLFAVASIGISQSPPPVPKIRPREIPKGATLLMTHPAPVPTEKIVPIFWPTNMDLSKYAGFGLEATEDLTNWVWLGWCNTDTNGVCTVSNKGSQMIYRVVGVSWDFVQFR